MYVVFEDRRCADDVPWEHVKLLFAGGTKTKGPYLGLNLTGFAGRSKFGMFTRWRDGQGCRSNDCSTVASCMNGVVIHHIGVSGAIVESVAAC